MEKRKIGSIWKYFLRWYFLLQFCFWMGWVASSSWFGMRNYERGLKGYLYLWRRRRWMRSEKNREWGGDICHVTTVDITSQLVHEVITYNSSKLFFFYQMMIRNIEWMRRSKERGLGWKPKGIGRQTKEEFLWFFPRVSFWKYCQILIVSCFETF